MIGYLFLEVGWIQNKFNLLLLEIQNIEMKISNLFMLILGLLFYFIDDADIIYGQVLIKLKASIIQYKLHQQIMSSLKVQDKAKIENSMTLKVVKVKNMSREAWMELLSNNFFPAVLWETENKLLVKRVKVLKVMEKSEKENNLGRQVLRYKIIRKNKVFNRRCVIRKNEQKRG